MTGDKKAMAEAAAGMMTEFLQIMEEKLKREDALYRMIKHGFIVFNRVQFELAERDFQEGTEKLRQMIDETKQEMSRDLYSLLDNSPTAEAPEEHH